MQCVYMYIDAIWLTRARSAPVKKRRERGEEVYTGVGIVRRAKALGVFIFISDMRLLCMCILCIIRCMMRLAYTRACTIKIIFCMKIYEKKFLLRAGCIIIQFTVLLLLHPKKRTLYTVRRVLKPHTH